MGLIVEGADSSHAREPSGNSPIRVVPILGYDRHFFTFQVDAGTLRWRVMRVNEQSLEVETVTSGSVSDAVWVGVLQITPVRTGIVALHDGNDRIETWRWNGSSVQRLTYDFVPTERSNASGIGAYGTNGRLLRIWPSGTWGGARTGVGYGQNQWGRAFTVSSDGSLAALTGEQLFWQVTTEFPWWGFDTHKGIAMNREGYGFAFGNSWRDPSGQDSSEHHPAGYSFHWDEGTNTFTTNSDDVGGEMLASYGSGGENSHEHYMVANGYASYVRITFDNVFDDGTAVRIYDHDADGTFVQWGQGSGLSNTHDIFGVDRALASGANDEDYWVGAFAMADEGAGNCKVAMVEVADRSATIIKNEFLPDSPASQGSTDTYAVGAGVVGAYYLVTWANATTRYWRTYYDISKLAVPYLRMNRRDAAERNPGARQAGNIQSSIRNLGGKIYV